jgi:enoyl-CoA hydratase/carnithine racemase
MTVAARVPGSSASREPDVLRRIVDDIAILTLNRPQTRNALTADMLAALQEHLAEFRGHKQIRAVIIAAEGQVFSAGHDLKELTAHRADADGGVAFTRRLMGSCSAAMLALAQLPQPVVAAVEGTATAAGCQLVASCDLAVASTTAEFCTPGVHIGLFCSTPMVAISRNVGRKHAMEMLLTGDTITAQEALQMGLINQVVDSGGALEAAMAMARKVAAKSAAVIKLGKEAYYRQAEMNLADAYDYAGEIMVRNMLARDAVEGISAFLEKRPPAWHDR